MCLSNLEDPLDPILNVLFEGIIKGIEDYWDLAGHQRKENLAMELSTLPGLKVEYNG